MQSKKKSTVTILSQLVSSKLWSSCSADAAPGKNKKYVQSWKPGVSRLKHKISSRRGAVTKMKRYEKKRNPKQCIALSIHNLIYLP